MRLKLIFVPRWLERSLKAANMSLRDALEPEKLVRILSSDDLKLYHEVNRELYHLVPRSIVQTFDLPFCKGSLPEMGFGKIDEEGLRAYLYGRVSTMYDGHLYPTFNVHRVGYDYVILTVGDRAAESQEDTDILMDELLKHLYAVTPLSELAQMSLFREHLNNHCK